MLLVGWNHKPRPELTGEDGEFTGEDGLALGEAQEKEPRGRKGRARRTKQSRGLSPHTDLPGSVLLVSKIPTVFLSKIMPLILFVGGTVHVFLSLK